ncbi:MAG: peptidyl-prolyl cis-trans isomerase cpr6 [Pleopsidium flavum]|nr:MAG: peptidyl-prolyl cis-trans isomerase cpr6 [Pleopsidium flavum]
MVDIKGVHKVFGFLGLPGELRNKVYRYLLAAVYTSKGSPSTCYNFAPSILRVNHQIHGEASSILYEENIWIVVKANWTAFDFNGWLKSIGFPVFTLLDVGYIKKPSLKIEASFTYSNGETGVVEVIAVALANHLLYEISHCFWRNADKYSLDLTLTLGSPPYQVTRSQFQDALLRPFGQARGVKKVIIKGAASEADRKALKNLMESQVSNWEEVLETLARFKKMGDVAFTIGELKEAWLNYRRGIRYLQDCTQICREDLESRGFIWTNRFEALCGQICNSMSGVCVKLGRFDEAVKAANDALIFPGIRDMHRARAHYRRGLAYIGLNQDVEAAKDFFYARDLVPGDPTIKERLRAVETRVGKTITEEDAPLFRTTFLYGNIREWRGDPRLVEDWGMDAFSRLEQSRMR